MALSLVGFQLLLERRELGERRVRVGLAASAPVLRIDPLARLAVAVTIAILEVAAALAARTVLGPIALGAIAAAAIALTRPPFGTLRPVGPLAAIAPLARRTPLVPLGARCTALGRRRGR